MAVGQAIALATNTNPTKIVGSDKLLPCLQQMLDGFRKADPPTIKQLPMEADVPEFLVQLGLSLEAGKLDRALGDLTMIAFYYLLHIGKYTTKGTHNNSKQTEEFKMGNITFFAKDKQRNLRCLPRNLGLHSRISRHKIKKTRKSSTYATIKKAESTNEQKRTFSDVVARWRGSCVPLRCQNLPPMLVLPTKIDPPSHFLPPP